MNFINNVQECNPKAAKARDCLFLRAAQCLPVERAPVWMMRQAGRTDPEYRKLREDDPRPLEDLFCDVEQAIKISLMPMKLEVDAIIMFQDILTPLAPLGAEFHFVPGPVFKQKFDEKHTLTTLRKINPKKDLAFVGDILQGIKAKLPEHLALLGFAGSPITLAFFMIAGGSPTPHYQKIFEVMQSKADFFRELCQLLTEMTIDYLNYQIDCGADCVQLFESWGDIIPRELYEKFVQPVHQAIFKALPKDFPKILFVKENNFLDLFVETGANVLSLGKCVSLQESKKFVKDNFAVQGNVDNEILLKSFSAIEQATEDCLTQGKGLAHILNLNHGLLAQTPFENVQCFVKAAKKLRPSH